MKKQLFNKTGLINVSNSIANFLLSDTRVILNADQYHSLLKSVIITSPLIRSTAKLLIQSGYGDPSANGNEILKLVKELYPSDHEFVDILLQDNRVRAIELQENASSSKLSGKNAKGTRDHNAGYTHSQ